MGRAQRQKGYRNERELVLKLQEWGYSGARRQPYSGALKEYPGDVKVPHENRDDTIIEVKSRKNEYNKVYSLFEQHEMSNMFSFEHKERCVHMTTSFELAEILVGVYYTNSSQFGTDLRTFNKIVNMEKLLGKATVLAIKGNNKPWIFITYK